MEATSAERADVGVSSREIDKVAYLLILTQARRENVKRERTSFLKERRKGDLFREPQHAPSFTYW